MDPVDPDPALADVSGPVDKAQVRPPNAAMPNAAAATAPLRPDTNSTIFLKSILILFPAVRAGPLPGQNDTHTLMNGPTIRS